MLFQQKTRTGLLSDFIIDQMVDQCDGDIGPAVSFYGCIENTTQLPTVWAAMVRTRMARTCAEGFLTTGTLFFSKY